MNSRFSVYVAFASLSCGDLVERTRVCGITVHSAASDRLYSEFGNCERVKSRSQIYFYACNI